MTIDRNTHFITKDEALLIMTDETLDNFTHEGPMSLDEAAELMVQDGGELQAVRLHLKNGRVDVTEFMEDVTDELRGDDEADFDPSIARHNETLSHSSIYI